MEGAPATKPARQVAGHEAVAVTDPLVGWASRGASKLLGALKVFPVDPAGRVCLDAGASTGGFTDVLLARGAAHVVAVDVGYGQLAWRLRTDRRVSVLDRTNVRHLTRRDLPEQLDGPVELVTADLSFISLRLVMPALAAVADDRADYLLLVKPQFEAGRGNVGKGGVVRDPQVWRAALLDVAEAAEHANLRPREATVSPEPGPKGNVEFFWWLSGPEEGGADAEPWEMADAAVAAASQLKR